VDATVDGAVSSVRPSRADELVVLRPEGLYCPPGDFYIDPWRPVDRAVITHAHGDHARPGHAHYLAAAPGEGVLRTRLGPIALQTLAYGETIAHHGVRLSLHPAGHVLGSAQVRLEHRGRVWVASGDYKVMTGGHGEIDPTCPPFEPIRCDVFITESTFGLPIYRWQPQREIFAGIDDGWRANAASGRASVLFCYAFGKAQRILAGVDADIGPIFCHGAVEPLNRAYREAGVRLPPTTPVSEVTDRSLFARGLVLAPPSAAGSPWMKRFGEYGDAFASGWMQLRGARRRRALDRGFVLSDHADWPGLHAAIAATGAARVIVTHGQVPVMVRWLCENGLDAEAFETEFGDEGDGGPDAEGRLVAAV
jgi:putative mRNA 3-end processing factor